MGDLIYFEIHGDPEFLISKLHEKLSFLAEASANMGGGWIKALASTSIKNSSFFWRAP